MNYSEKMDIFYNKVLPSRIDSKEWTPVAVEQRFEFVYDDRVIIQVFLPIIYQHLSWLILCGKKEIL